MSYTLISIIIYLVLLIVIGVLTMIITKNRDRKLRLYEKNEQDKAQIVDNINKKTAKEIKDLRNEVIEAKSFDSIKSVLIDKLFN